MKKILALVAVVLFVGSQMAIAGESVFKTGANSDGSYEFSMTKDEGLKVGNGTPTVTMNGEDAYIEGTLEVGGALTVTGAVTATAGLYTASGTALPTTGYTAGALFYDTDGFKLYVATATVNDADDWVALH